MSSAGTVTPAPSRQVGESSDTFARSDRPRVIVVGPSPPPFNGMSVATQLILGNLQQNLEIFHLDTADRRGLQNVGKLEFTNIVLALLHGGKFLISLATFRPDLVYVPISQSRLPFLRDCLFLIPAKLLGRRTVVHLHGSDFRSFYESQPGWLRALVRFAIGGNGRAIVLGDRLIGMFQEILPASSISVVPNGIPDLFEGVVTRKAGKPTVLFLSTLMKEKGVLDLVQAVPSVAERFPDCQFTFAGEWLREEEKQEAERFLRQHQLQGQVEFCGPVGPAAKKELLERASIFVLPSYHEGQPFAILEALCASLPVVATDVGCVTDLVRDKQNGFIVDCGSPASLADRIAKLLSDARLRERMGAESRAVFLAQHTEKAFVKDLSAALHRAASPDSI